MNTKHKNMAGPAVVRLSFVSCHGLVADSTREFIPERHRPNEAESLAGAAQTSPKRARIGMQQQIGFNSCKIPGVETPWLTPNSNPSAQHQISFREEIANSISHGLGLILAIAVVPVLVLSALRIGNTHFLVGACVYGATMVLLYLASTLYHSLTHEGAKRFFRLFDHSAIFLLIAGTYTPFTLGVLHGPWGWSLLTIVWVLAVAGIVMKAIVGVRYSWVSIVLYLLMGWLAVIAVKPILLLVPLHGILWILAGGIAYTGGLVFFAAPRLRYSHCVWHLFVIAGTTCHFFAVLWYAA
jgi:hemolysin III